MEIGVLSSIIGVFTAVATGLAVLGQIRWRAVQEWESLAEARGERLKTLEAEVLGLKAQIDLLHQELAELRTMNFRLQRDLQREQQQREKSP